MKTLKWLLAGLVVGVILSAFRDFEHRRWLRPAVPVRRQEPGGREPVLGYDGMEQETLLEWLEGSALDGPTIVEILRYEEANRRREPVLEVLEAMLTE